MRRFIISFVILHFGFLSGMNALGFDAPVVVTMPPDSITTHTAILHAACNPNGQTAALYFLVGIDSTYSIMSTDADTIAAGTENLMCSIRIDQLSPDSKYFVWAVARNVSFPDVMSQGRYQTFSTLCDSNASGIIIPLNITSAHGNSCRLTFGVHTSATARIDPALGEYELPPWPPDPESFWARFSGTYLGFGSDRDYRTFNSERQTDTFNVIANAGMDGFPLTLSWGPMSSMFDSVHLIQSRGRRVDMVNETGTRLFDSASLQFRIVTIGPHPVRHLPNIITNLPMNVSAGSAEVSTLAIPNGDETFVWYQWGLSTDYGKSTLPQDIGDSVRVVTVRRTLTGLVPGTGYHFRSVAENVAGRSFGMDEAFVTPPISGVGHGDGFPAGFVLSQNHPNPFNRETIIEYSLPLRKNVSLRIYDILGREILVRDEGAREAGTYRVPIDMEGFPTGMYFYQLRAGSFNSVRGMLYGK